MREGEGRAGEGRRGRGARRESDTAGEHERGGRAHVRAGATTYRWTERKSEAARVQHSCARTPATRVLRGQRDRNTIATRQQLAYADGNTTATL